MQTSSLLSLVFGLMLGIGPAVGQAAVPGQRSPDALLPSSLSPLSASGTKVVDASGAPVLLRGVNLGS